MAGGQGCSFKCQHHSGFAMDSVQGPCLARPSTTASDPLSRYRMCSHFHATAADAETQLAVTQLVSAGPRQWSDPPLSSLSH